MISGVPQGAILKPVLFNVCISDLDALVECMVSNSVEDSKLGGVADSFRRGDKRPCTGVWTSWSTVESSMACNLTRANVGFSTWGAARADASLGWERSDSREVSGSAG